jgi:Xaa-Pro aminopeptidase
MAARGLDCLIAPDPANMHYLTGYDGWSFYVHQGVLLGLEGDRLERYRSGRRWNQLLSQADGLPFRAGVWHAPAHHEPRTALARSGTRLSGRLLCLELDGW